MSSESNARPSRALPSFLSLGRITSLGLTGGFLLLAVAIYFPPVDQVPYVVFFLLFVVIAGASSWWATRCESQLESVVEDRIPVAESPLLGGLWRLYSDTFEDLPSGTRVTVALAGDYFHTDSVVAESNRRHFPILGILKSVPGTFTGLGILGTFVGFAAGLQHFDATTSDAIQKSVQGLVNGMKTGFFYSVIGIAMSIVFNLAFLQPFLRRMDQLTESLADRLDAQFHVSTGRYLLTGLTVQGESAIPPHEALRLLLDISQKQMDAMEGFSAKVATAIQTSVQASMEPLLLKISDTLDKLQQARATELEGTTEGILDALEKLMKDLVASMTGSFQARLEGLINTMEKTSDNLRGLPDLMDGLMVKLQSGQAAAGEALSGAAGTIEVATGGLRELLGSIQSQQAGMMEKTQQALAEIQAGFERLRIAIIEAGDGMEHFQPVLERIQNTARSVAQLTEGLNTSQTQQLESLRDLGASLEKQREQLQNQGEAVTLTMSQAKATADGFRGLDEELTRTLEGYQRQVEQYQAAVEKNLQALMQEFTRFSTGMGTSMNAAVVGLSETVDELATALKEQGRERR